MLILDHFWLQSSSCREYFLPEFYIRKCVYRKSMSITVQRDATIYSLFIPANCSTCFGWWHLYPTTIAGGSSSNTATSTRCCKYSYMCSWWWVVSPPVKHTEQFAAINKLYIVATHWTVTDIYFLPVWIFYLRD